MTYRRDCNVLQDHIDRHRPGWTGTSVTRQLADRFAAAIESGELEPGEKLPPTRALAEEAGVNHLTAARVYRRLAEEGYVTATVGRGTFVRTLTPSAGEEHGDDWQSLALPERAQSYSEESLADVFAFAGDPNVISLGTGWPAPEPLPHRAARADHPRRPRRGGRRRLHLPDRCRPRRPARAAGRARAQGRLRERARGDPRHLGRPAGDRPHRSRAGRARRHRRRGVPHLLRPAVGAAGQRRARDRRARRRGRAGRGRARGPGRPARAEARRAADRLPEPHRRGPLPRAPRAAGRPRARAQPDRAWRTASTATCASTAPSPARCASLRPRT